MKQEPIEFTMRVHTEADGSMWAEVPELPGCFASGDTEDELLEALAEAVAMSVTEDGATPPELHIASISPAIEERRLVAY